MNEPAEPTSPTRVIDLPSRRAAARLYVITLAALLILRGFTAAPQADVPVRNMDEHLMFAVGVSSLTGGPGNTLGWPGGSMRVATTLLVPTVFAVEHAGTILHRRGDVPAEFVRFLGHELRDPWRMVALLRWTSIVLSSVGFACLPLVLRRLTASGSIAFVLAIVALSGGTFWVRSLMATGDAVGWATAVVGLWAAVRARESTTSSHRWTFVAAVCAGLATASKLTSIYLWPLLFLAPIVSRRTFVRGIAIWLVAAPLGHYLLNPYVVTDPIRFAKAVAGNLLTRGVNTPLAAAVVDAVPIALVVLAVASLPITWSRRTRWCLLGTLGTLALYAVTIRRAAMIEPHYLAPLAIPASMLATLTVDWLARRRPLAARPAIVIAALAILVGASLVSGVRQTRQAAEASFAKYGVGEAAVRYLESIGFAGQIAVEPSQSYHDLFIAKIETDASMADRLARFEARVAGGRSVAATLAKSGLDPVVAAGLADAFNDSDRMMIANYRSMAVAGVARGPFVIPVRVPDATLADRAGVSFTRAEAMDALRRGEVDAVLLAAEIDGTPPTRDFGGISASERSVLYLRATPSTMRP